MIKNTIVVLYLLFACSMAYSQTDNSKEYFVTNSGSTIYGEIIKKFDENQKQYFQFKSNENRLYEEGEISSFKTKSGDIYVNSIAKEGFARQILTGELDLYIAYDEFIVEDKNGSIYYLEQKADTIKSEGKVFIRESNSWIGILQQLTKSCETLNPNELKFNERIITNYIKDYHDCINEEYDITNKTTKLIETQIGITFGVSDNSLSIEQESSVFRYYPANQRNRNYYGGIDIYLTFPRKNTNISYSSGLQFQDNTFNSIFVVGAPQNAQYFSQINYSMLTIPLMANYTFDFNQFKLMLSGGLHINTLLSQDVILLEENLDTGDLQEVDENFKLSLKSANLGFNAKVSLFTAIDESLLGIFAGYVGNNSIGSGDYNNSQPYGASIGMFQFGIQIIR